MEFLLIALTIVSAAAEGFIDAARSKKTEIEHYLSFWVRVVLMGVAPFLLLYNIKDFYLNLLFSGILGSIYWIVFDLAFNTMAGNHWGHTGTTSKIDKFMDKIGGPEEIILTKVFVGMLFFMLYDILGEL